MQSVEKWKIYCHWEKKKKIRQIKSLVISLGKPLFSRNFLQVRVIFHTTAVLWGVEKWKIYYHISLKKISSNQLFSNFFSKTVTFTKFLPKTCIVFPYCFLTFSILRTIFFLTINFSVFVGPFEAFVLLMADPGADGGDTVIWVWAIWK